MSFYFVSLFLSQLQASHKQRWISLVDLTRCKKKRTQWICISKVHTSDLLISNISKMYRCTEQLCTTHYMVRFTFSFTPLHTNRPYLISYSEDLCMKNRTSFPFRKDELKLNILYKTCLPQQKGLHSSVNYFMSQSSLQEQQVLISGKTE